MTYFEKLQRDPSSFLDMLAQNSCPGDYIEGGLLQGPNCPFTPGSYAGCRRCWNQQVPGTEGIATGAALPRNDRFPGLPPQLKSSSVDALIKLLAGQIEHWEAMRNSYAYEATVAQARKPGDCHDQCEHWSRNDSEKAETLAGKIKACEALVEQYKALSVELEKYREVCGYGRCD